MTDEDFKKYYIEHHGQLVLPYFLNLGVLYYAQVRYYSWPAMTQSEACVVSNGSVADPQYPLDISRS